MNVLIHQTITDKSTAAVAAAERYRQPDLGFKAASIIDTVPLATPAAAASVVESIKLPSYSSCLKAEI